MTAFLLLDEFERDFEPLEDQPIRHGLAIAAYCIIGQAVAQRMTDGLIPVPLLRKKLVWPKRMVDTAVSDLLNLGLWREHPETKELSFRDWDLSQFTRKQELARREKNAARQRAKRARDKSSVTRDVPRDVTTAVTLPTTSPLPSQSERGTYAEGYSASRVVLPGAVADLEPVPLTGDARLDATNAALGLKQPVRVVR